MNTPADHGQTPKERLEHVARAARPFHHQVFGPNYLVALALLGLLLALVAVAAVGGSLGSDLVGGYARRILEWAAR